MKKPTSLFEHVERSLENQAELEERIKAVENQNLTMQEAMATMYEDQNKYKLQMQEAIMNIYEMILEGQGKA